jgi:hypothetical protein
MNTPDATKPQPPVMSPTGEPFKPHYVVDLFGANEQTGGEAKTTDVPRFVPRVPIVPRTVAAPAGLPGQFPEMTGLQPGETPQVVLPTGSRSIFGPGGKKKRKSMKKKSMKKKSMKKKKTMKRKSMKKRR